MGKDVVVQYIKDLIIQGKCAPGERLVERKICEELNVGRSPVREALRYLEQENFIEIVKHRGAVVKQISQRDIIQNYDIIGVLEGLAVRIAIANMTEEDIDHLKEVNDRLKRNVENRFFLFNNNLEFHRLIAKFSGNDRLIELLERLYSQSRRSSVTSFSNQEQVQATLAEHQSIIDAIGERDADRAERLIREHYQGSKNRLIRMLNRTL